MDLHRLDRELVIQAHVEESDVDDEDHVHEQPSLLINAD